MRQMIAVALTSSLLLFGTGCMTVAKRTLKEAKGAGSDAVPVPGTGGGSFAKFQSVTIDQPKTELGGLVPSEFGSHLVSCLRKELMEGKEPMFTGGTPALSIEPTVLWYNKGNPIFPHKYAVILYQLRGDGADMGKVQVVTKSEATGTGVKDMAESNAEELAKYFKKHGKKKPGEKEEKS